jgi:hypothetical protein
VSKLGKFGAFLERLQKEHCRPKCHHDATQCPIARALDTAGYSEFKWCPLCGGYKIGEVENTEGKGKLAKKVQRWLLGGSGGLIRGFLPDGYYKAVFACSCEVGQYVRIDGKRIKAYDFKADPGSENDCFKKRRSDLFERDTASVRERSK